MKKSGFTWLRDVDSIQYVDAQDKPKKINEIKSPADVLLDQIFACDENGWPQSTLQVYLSEKTADDVRRFIEQNILVNSGPQNIVQDEKVVAEYKNLSNDFIAACSRNRFESIEQYEARLQEMVDDDNNRSAEESMSAWRSKFFAKYGKKD